MSQSDDECVNLLTSSQSSSSTPSGSVIGFPTSPESCERGIRCLEKHLITTLDACCFYIDNKGVQFGVKESEYRRFVCKETTGLYVKLCGSRALCRVCSRKVGAVHENTWTTLFFNKENVIIPGIPQKWKWGAIETQLLPEVQRETLESSPPPLSLLRRERIAAVLNLPSPTSLDLADSNLIPVCDSSKVPRDYQLQAFFLCLVANTVVVIPTGKGKTYVASLVLSYLKYLNPKKLTLFLVTRVPLVHQQKGAIARDTGMRVCCMSSENHTAALRKKITDDDDFDVIVATAGLFLNLIEQQILRFQEFSCIVFDECHHVVGNDNYTRILSALKSVVKDQQPRLVGLTASPVEDGELERALNKIESMKCYFLNAKIFRPPIQVPSISGSNENVDWAVKDLSAMQWDAQSCLIEELIPLLKQIQAQYTVELMKEKDMTLAFLTLKSKWPTVLQIGILAQEADISAGRECEQLVHKLEINYLLGPLFNDTHFIDSLETLNDDDLLEPSIRARISDQLQFVCERLSTLSPENRTLIFVETKHTVFLLNKFLRKYFRNLNSLAIVGQQGADGMSWRRDQKGILEKFRKGESTLLVCTAVLEEGLDVSACDLVVRLGGLPSLTQVIQSRGRARALRGKLLIVFTEQERKHYDEIRSREDLIDRALDKHAVDASGVLMMFQQNLTLLEAREMIEEDQNAETEVQRLVVGCMDSTSEISVLSEYSPAVYESDYQSGGGPALRFIVATRSWPGERIIRSFMADMQTNQLFDRISRIESMELLLDFHVGRNVFQPTDTTLLVQGESRSENVFSLLASCWNFLIGNTLPCYLCIPLPPLKGTDSFGDTTPCSNDTYRSPEASKELPIRKLHNGYFPVRNRFMRTGELAAVYGSMKREISVRLEPESSLNIVSHVSNVNGNVVGEMEIEIRKECFQHCFYLCANRKDKECILYVVLRSVPRVKYNLKKDSEFLRVAVQSAAAESDGIAGWAQADLKMLLGGPVLALTMALKEFDALVTDWFSDPSYLGLPCFITHIVWETSLHQQELDLVRNNFNLSGLVDSMTNADEEHGNAGRDMLWAFYALVSDMHALTASPKRNYQIYDYIQSALGQGDVTKFKAVTLAIQQLHALIRHQPAWQEDSALMFMDLLGKVIESTENFTSMQMSCLENPSLSTTHCQVGRVDITPSRVIVKPLALQQMNRVLRLYSKQFRFVYVNFADESGQRVYNSFYNQEIMLRFEEVLRDGFQICGEMFSYLLSSNSQLRNGTSIFVNASKSEISKIRENLVLNFGKMELHKRIVRLGLFATADIELGQLAENDCEVVSDIITSNSDHHVLTDGAGLVDHQYLKDLNIADSVSAIQIRCRGNKGVLTRKHGLNNATGRKVLFRDSMHKCLSLHPMMCLVKESCYAPLRLNREIITLLDTFGCVSIREAITTLNKDALQDIANILICPQAAFDMLRQHFDPRQIDTVRSTGVDILREPFWKSILLELYQHETKLLRMKSHIPVPEGCYLMGIPDPCGLLGENEVFFCIPKMREKTVASFSARAATERNEFEAIRANDDVDCEYEVITGPVLMYRNPCLDPGDVRLVQAVDKIELRAWRNVVIVPCHSGLVGPSLSAQCSGGDLDGDCFSLIWDKRFIPPASSIVEPVRYDEIDRGRKPERPESEEDFVMRNMTNSSLGRIAHMHLAISDKAAEGALNHWSRELAKQQSFAVDYPKNGIAPVIPSECRELIRQDGYPDFMEKGSKPSYVSLKVLGGTYRECNELRCEIQLLRENAQFCPDSDFTIAGYETYMLSAESTFRTYVMALQQNFIRYDVSSETEFVLGIQSQSRDFALLDGPEALAMKESWKLLQAQYRSIFEIGLQGLPMEERKKKASAWYNCAYAARKGLSFAWIMLDELCGVKMSAAPTKLSAILPEDGFGNGVCTVVGDSILQNWTKGLYGLQRAVQHKQSVFAQVQNAILGNPDNHHLSIALYGSVALLQCDEASDCDVSVVCRNTDDDSGGTEEAFLEKIVKPEISKIVSVPGICRLVSGTVPIIRADIDGGHRVDISARSEGVQKAQLLRKIFSVDAVYLVLFSSLRQWAESCGLICSYRFCEYDKGTVVLDNNGQFQALFVDYWIRHHGIDCTTLPDSKTDDELFAGAAAVNPMHLGFEMWKYFHCGMSRQDQPAWEFAWPLASAKKIVHVIDSLKMGEFANRCRMAIHFLAVSCSFEFLLERSREYSIFITTFEYELSRSTSEAIGNAFQYHTLRLMFKSKATVEIKPMNDENGAEFIRYKVFARGTPGQLQLVRKGLFELIYFNRCYGAGFAVRTCLSSTFMDQCTFLFSKLATTKGANLVLLPDPTLPKNYQHTHSVVSRLRLRSPAQRNWKPAFIEKLTEKILDQVRQVSSTIVHREEYVQFDCNFGLFYLIDAERVFDKRSGAYSCNEIEGSVSRSREEKMKRMELLNRALSESSQSNNNTSSSSSSSAGLRSPNPPSHENPRRRSRKASFIASSIYNGIPETVDSDRPDQIGTAIEQKVWAILSQCGFGKYDPSACNCLKCGRAITVPPTATNSTTDAINECAVIADCSTTDRVNWKLVTSLVPTTEMAMPNHDWLIHCQFDKNVGAEVVCNNKYQFDFWGSRYHWVHATLLHQKDATSEAQQQPFDNCTRSCDDLMTNAVPLTFADHDLRIKMGSSLYFKEQEEARVLQQFFPQGRLPIVVDEKSGDPRVNDNILGKGEVTFVRKVVSRVVYVNHGIIKHCCLETSGAYQHLICDSCRASFAESADAVEFERLDSFSRSHELSLIPKFIVIFANTCHYQGINLLDKSSACDISVQVDPGPISLYLDHKIDDVEFSKWVDAVLSDIVELSEALRNGW